MTAITTLHPVITLPIALAPGVSYSDVLRDLADRLEGFKHFAVGTMSSIPATTPQPASTPSSAPSPIEPEWWTAERAEALLAPMTPFSREVVRFVAEHGPVVPIDDVIEHFHLANGFALGGKMSSLGFALKKVPGAVNPLPAGEQDYEIDPTVAQVLLAALEKIQPKG